MEKKQNKVVEFVKKNGKAIAIGAGAVATAACGVVIYAVTKKTGVPSTLEIPIFKRNDIEVPNWKLGNLTACWRETGFVNLIVGDFTVADLGKFGDELMKLDGVTPETVCSTVMSFEDTMTN